MNERLNRIGELLAKGVYLHLKKEKEAKLTKEQKNDDLNRLSDLPVVIEKTNRDSA
jgi:hypothetical protein